MADIDDALSAPAKQRDLFDYARSPGLLVLALSRHEPGDYGDSSINDPITTAVDFGICAGGFLTHLTTMEPERVAGLVRQWWGYDLPPGSAPF
jgi:hypothetical protein